MFVFNDKVALIFGAGQNIGREIALEFARRGCHVGVADLNIEGAKKTAEEVSALGVKSVAIHCNITDEVSIGLAIEQIESTLGDLDILMNNAGILHSGNPEDFPVSEWQRMFDVNFFGAVRANTIILPKFLAKGRGYIVNTASFAGLYPYATNRIPYAASKAALISMSENLAISLKPRGINVSCLCPGPTMTTSTVGLKPWSDSVVMRGPGAQYPVASQADVAKTLADAMEQEQIIVLTHPEGINDVQERAASPDNYIRMKIDKFKVGKSGLPGRD